MSTALSIDTQDKIAINGVDLLNRHELSPYQDKELQRYIDEHSLVFKDREREEPVQKKVHHNSNYSSLSREMSRGASPLQGYNTLDKYFKKTNKEEAPEYRQIGLNTPQPSPSVEHANYTTDFPGLENSVDNSFLLQYGGKILESAGIRPESAQGNYAGSTVSSRQYDSLPRESSHYGSVGNGTSHYGNEPSHYGGSNCGTLGNGTASHYGTLGSASNYGTMGKGGMKGAASPYNSLKRKGVSWSDQERARSLSPQNNNQQRIMSQYGSTGNLSNFRDRTASPAYSNLGRHRMADPLQDDYNRFETVRHAAAHKAQSPFEESRFGGFGDRPGSGVELASHQWHGGEVINDPNQVPKGIKPRRFYYSPIGDGTVAADGYELKRRPVDLSPRVTITQLQHVDRGEKGKDGVNIYEKSWTNVGPTNPSEGGYGSEYGPGSGRNSRAGAFSPSGDPFGGKGGPNAGAGAGGPGQGGPGGLGGAGAGGPGGLGGPGGPGGLGNGGLGGPGSGRGGDPYGSGRPSSGLGDRNPYGSNGNIGPNDGRMSVASSGFSDPSYRFDTKTGYLITNPRELIHQYATTTPIAVMDTNDHTPSTTTISKQSMYRRTEETTEERYAPYAPYKSANTVQSPNKFVRQLRDDTMTQSQREANTHLDAMNQRDPHASEKIQQIRQKTSYSTRGGNDDIDSLTNQLVSGLQVGTPVPSRF